MKHFSLLIVISLIVSCTSQKKSDKTIVIPPENFAGKKDSGNAALLSYKIFLQDSDLVNLIDEVLKNNPDANIAWQKINGNRAQYIAKRGGLLPVVSGNVLAAQRKYGLYTMDGAGNMSTYMRGNEIVPEHLQDYFVGFQASWELDLWGKLNNRRKASLNRFIASIEGRNFLITNLISEVAFNYYELLALDNILEILNETIALQENAVTLVKAQKQAGMVNELAVNQLETQLLGTKSLERETSQLKIICENKINFLAGRFPTEIKRNKKILFNTWDKEIKLGNPTELLKNRSDIREKEYELIAAKADVKAAKRAFYPSLNLTGGWGVQAYKTELLLLNPESIAYSIIGNLLAPLINRTALKAELKSANALQMEAVLNYRKNVIRAYLEVLNEYSAINNYQKIQDLRIQQVNIATESSEISTELFKTGKATYLEVIVSQQNALEAKLQNINARKMKFVAAVNLYKALGGGWR
jgi:outer membrane protein, multidrug efflux system